MEIWRSSGENNRGRFWHSLYSSRYRRHLFLQRWYVFPCR